MIKECLVKKKPITVKCVQFTKELTDHELRTWSNRNAFIAQLDREDEPCVIIIHQDGAMRAHYGDWIMMGSYEDVYPIREDIFNATYDFVRD